jgi:hypothetical protein
MEIETPAYDKLMEWSEDLPVLTDAELDHLLSIGGGLPALLAESDLQSEAELDRILKSRMGGEPWPELRASWKLILRERFEYAFAVIEGMAVCQVPEPPGFHPGLLLTQGWAESGAGRVHDDFLRRYLPELLERAGNGRDECEPDSGG